MPSYAILGATGNTGQALLNVLLQSPDNQINAYCRSKQKLVKMSPAIADNKQVKVFEGNLEDEDLLARCFTQTRAVFLVIAQTENEPNCSIARDTSRAVVSVLEKLHAEKEHLPKLIVLSSASLDHSLMSSVPRFMLRTLYCAFANVYDDLREAEKFLRSKESLVSATFIRPGALSHDEQKGHTLSLDTAKTPLSYLDLAAGMIEVADETSGRYDMKGVAVNPVAASVAFPWDAPLLGIRGLLFYFFPWVYPYLKG